MAITSFSKTNRFLSNFYPLITDSMQENPVGFGWAKKEENSIVYHDVLFETVEAAYQSAKCPKLCDIFSKLSPKDAKRLGRHIVMRPDFESEKISIMEDLVRQKFTKSEYLKKKLLETGDEELVEGNNWGDRFWGVDGNGENHLGKILMKIRGELRDSE